MAKRKKVHPRHAPAGSAVWKARLEGIIKSLPETPKPYSITRNVIVSSPGEERRGPRRFELQTITVRANSISDAKWLADLAKQEREEAIGHQYPSPSGSMR